jgi:hypothetical protein
VEIKNILDYLLPVVRLSCVLTKSGTEQEINLWSGLDQNHGLVQRIQEHVLYIGVKQRKLRSEKSGIGQWIVHLQQPLHRTIKPRFCRAVDRQGAVWCGGAVVVVASEAYFFLRWVMRSEYADGCKFLVGEYMQLVAVLVVFPGQQFKN